MAGAVHHGYFDRDGIRNGDVPAGMGEIMLGLENLGPELQTALTAVLGPALDRITSLEATVAAQAAALETKTAADVATLAAQVETPALQRVDAIMDRIDKLEGTLSRVADFLDRISILPPKGAA